MKKILFLCMFVHLLQGFAIAAEVTSEDLQALKDLVQSLSERVESQEARIQALELENQALRVKKGEVPVPEIVPPPSPSGDTRWSGRFKQGLQAFNPEIGGLVDIAGILTESDEDSEGNDKVSVREIELVIGHDVDPYCRYDSTITFSDFEEVTVEEASITHWGLPWDLRAKLGRMRPKIGKASVLHRDALETADEPLVVQNYLGVEGLFRTGLELSWFVPFPWEVVTHDLTVGIMEGGIGEEGTLFGETRKRPSFYAHLKNFWDISHTTNLELGGSYLLGSSDEDAKYEVNALGLDATLIHYFDPTHRLKLLAEFYFQDRNEPFISGEDEEILPSSFEDDPWGMYALMDYRLSPRFSVGGRWDYVIPTDIDPFSLDEADMGISGYLTFHQSEFVRWRLQYQHVEAAEGTDDERVFVQGTFVFGVHKHQLQ